MSSHSITRTLEDWTLQDLIERIEVTHEIVAETHKNLADEFWVSPETLEAMHHTGNVLARAADYLYELYEERTRVSA